LSYVKDRVRPLGTRKLDLVGVTEVKEFLGVSRQRVHQLIRDDTGFPNPVAELAAGRIWLREDIEEWARSCGRLERDDRAVSRARGKRRRL
jgi:predicted DNA-binding transcriptional regulator AlpA